MIRLILFLCFILHFELYSQYTSLETCMDMAIRNSTDIKIQLLSKRSAELQHQQTINNLLPSINVGSNVNYNIGYSISPLDYSYISQNSISGSLNVSAQLTLFQGFQQLKNIQKTSIDTKIYDYQIISLENNIKIQTINLYLQTMLEFDVLKSLKNQYDYSQELYSNKKEMLREGLIAENALKEIKWQVDIDLANLQRQEFQVQNSLNKLKLFLKIPFSNDFIIDTSHNDIVPQDQLTFEDIDSKNVSLHPDVQVEFTKLQSLNKQLEIYKGGLLPTVTFGYSFGTNFINTSKTYEYKTIKNPAIGFFGDSNYTYVRSISNQQIPISEQSIPIFTQMGNNKQHQLQLNFQWPIFSKFSKHTTIKMAKISLQQQEEKIELTKQKIKENYYQATLNVKSAYQKYVTNKLVSKAQGEKYKMANEKFQNNLIDYFELLTYQSQYLNAKIELTKSKLEWFFNKKIVDLYE